MAGEGQLAIERLRSLLHGLKPAARAKLIAAIELALPDGDNASAATMLPAELRGSARLSHAKPSRLSDPARMFFQPLEPFLIGITADHRYRGRIARGALEPIWLWLANTVMPDEARTYCEAVENALARGDTVKAEELARAFQHYAAGRIQSLLASLEKNDRERRRLTAQLGAPHAIEDVRVLCTVLAGRDRLAALTARLPHVINNLVGPQLDNVKALIDTQRASHSGLFLYALVLAMGRLAAPWQLVRLATRAAGGDDAERVAETPYAAAVDIALDEIDRRICELIGDLKGGRTIAAPALLKDIHDELRGLRSELDLSLDSPWGRRLAAVRAKISGALTAEIELIPGRVRRLIRPRQARDIAPGSILDPEDVAETEALIGLVIACRNYAGELAVNEAAQRVFSELEQCLDTGTRALLDAMRHSRDGERTFRQSQTDAAVRFCAKMFGKKYASLLAKAADVAGNGERRFARI
jgi:hypothetical protein